MLRRLVLLVVSALAILLLAAGAGSGASSPPPYQAYDGTWTPDTTSSSHVAADAFKIVNVTEAEARAVTGNFQIDFDTYCKSTNPGVAPVNYFLVTFASTYGQFGACESGKTDGHDYGWNTNQVWYAHTETSKGEPVLRGAVENETTSPHAVYKFTAHHPLLQFLTHVKFSALVPNKPHVAEVSTITGLGELRLIETRTDCFPAGVVSGDGSLAVSIVKIGGPSVVELDDLTVAPDPSQDFDTAEYACENGQTLNEVAVTVKKSDPAEKDGCPVGSPGVLSLADRSAQRGGDLFQLVIPNCKVGLLLRQSQAKKGSNVAVALTVDAKGY